jgi:hypothetical protein
MTRILKVAFAVALLASLVLLASLISPRSARAQSPATDPPPTILYYHIAPPGGVSLDTSAYRQIRVSVRGGIAATASVFAYEPFPDTKTRVPIQIAEVTGAAPTSSVPFSSGSTLVELPGRTTLITASARDVEGGNVPALLLVEGQ